MIVRVLQSCSSTKSILDYSEKKCAEGNAYVVRVNNLPGDDMYSIYSTFEKYESNPAIAAKTKNISFHLAVNPGVDDGITREQSIQFIKELMDTLGYGNQPYVVYRHNDIDREHYHIVSVRVNERGRVISDSYDRPKIKQLSMSLQAKYNFTWGLPKNAETKDIKPGKISETDNNLLDRLKVNFYDVLNNYHYNNLAELQACLLSRGIILKDKPEYKYDKYLFGVGNEYGNFTSHCYSSKTTVKKTPSEFEADIQSGIRRNISSQKKDMQQAEEYLELCLDRFSNTYDIVHALRNEGYTLSLKYDENKKLSSAVIVDERQRCALNVAMMNARLFAMLQTKSRKRKVSEEVLEINQSKRKLKF